MEVSFRESYDYDVRLIFSCNCFCLRSGRRRHFRSRWNFFKYFVELAFPNANDLEISPNA